MKIEKKGKKETVSPIKKLISKNYGRDGLQIFELIDGHRTAHDIMRKSGISESRFSEIVHSIIEQSIVKVDYPKEIFQKR